MTLLTNYNDFLSQVDELGFLFLSQVLAGMPSLGSLTSAQSWHTGDPETDPWQWKDRAAQEKRAAYGCILGGHKGFIAARLYPFFYAACHPRAAMPERYAAGEVNQTIYQVWQLFEQKTLLNTSDVRRELGASPKSGASRVDGALQELQRQFYLAIAGNRRKTAKDGQPYGWPNSVYDRVQAWAPAEWMAEVGNVTHREARLVILDAGCALSPEVQPDELARTLKL
jgi:hypothetical protein